MAEVNALTFSFDGRPMTARAGDTVASALWAAGVRSLRRSLVRGEPRGLFCGMGICYDCLVHVDGRAMRACMLPVRDGMVVESGR